MRDSNAKCYKEIIKKETEGRGACPDMAHQSKREESSPISVPYAWWLGEHKNRCVVVGRGEGHKREERKPEDGGCPERAWL